MKSLYEEMYDVLPKRYTLKQVYENGKYTVYHSGKALHALKVIRDKTYKCYVIRDYIIKGNDAKFCRQWEFYSKEKLEEYVKSLNIISVKKGE